MSNHVEGGRPWIAYFRAAFLLAPSLIFFAVAVVFILPKIKQMCADTNYDARYLFRPIDLAAGSWWIILIGIVAVCVALERWVPWWDRCRTACLTFVIFIINSAVLLGLVTSLVVAAIVGPAMTRHF